MIKRSTTKRATRSNTICRTVCLTDSSNDRLVKDKGAQIFYSILSQTKSIGIGANCEIPHNAAPTTRTYDLGSDTTCRTVCLTDSSNDQLVKDKGAQIFYRIRLQTKSIGIGHIEKSINNHHTTVH